MLTKCRIVATVLKVSKDITSVHGRGNLKATHCVLIIIAIIAAASSDMSGVNARECVYESSSLTEAAFKVSSLMGTCTDMG